MDFTSRELLLCFMMLVSISFVCQSFRVSPYSMSCNSSLTTVSCHASLYFVPNTKKTPEETSSIFNVNPDVVVRTVDGYLIGINCSCLPDHTEFSWHTDYTVQPGDTWESVSLKLGSFVVEKLDKVLIPSQTVTLDLLCGCLESTYFVAYKVQKGDTLFTICSRFQADLNNTARVNKLEKVNLIHVGDIIFIPDPGLENLTTLNDEDTRARKVSKSHTHIIIVGAIVGISFVILLSIILILWNFYKRKGSQPSMSYSRRRDCMHYYSNDFYSNKYEESVVSSISSDKATVFPYHEICDATSNFSIHLKIGQGSYGSVYLGKLRGIDVAIKQMKNTKSKEFLSEVNIFRNVHHTSLIELIGYAAGGDSLFLVYEYAQNGALSDHLHKPILKGCERLPWTTRVQIALDAAKGLAYIHEYTKPYYVHRDVKTSNILLDAKFRAKIADFGLVKLLEDSSEVGAAASRIVGTFGYLAPEYARDGPTGNTHATQENTIHSESTEQCIRGVTIVYATDLSVGAPTPENPLWRAFSSRLLVFAEQSSPSRGVHPRSQIPRIPEKPKNLVGPHPDTSLGLSKKLTSSDWRRNPRNSNFKITNTKEKC